MRNFRGGDLNELMDSWLVGWSDDNHRETDRQTDIADCNYSGEGSRILAPLQFQSVNR